MPRGAGPGLGRVVSKMTDSACFWRGWARVRHIPLSSDITLPAWRWVTRLDRDM
jgi:hypothetical protein